ncbi:uncharacterized protein LOC136073868 [Hydra vulgaris]|uniref:uncharacterized protein LOC136073868 n=1 Tax=Hydra vulgaris TaxID=6087 RepID=UPI0032EA6A4B
MPKEWSMPVDKVDKTAYIHDLAYKHYPDKEHRNLADKMMLEQMDAIPNPTLREKLERKIIKPIISAKVRFGMGNKEPMSIKESCEKNYKRTGKKKKTKRKVIANGIDDIWAADLVDMQSYSKFNGIKYLLMVIDIFSKYGWIFPLKNKTGIEVANGFNKIFKDRKCNKLWVNKGLEFYNKHVKALGVHLYSTENEEKSCVVERWNRTMKEKMFKYFSANSTRKYIDVLDEMVNQYNNTKHSSIKMTPIKASDKKNENIVFLNLNSKVRSKSPNSTFSISDKVRITKKKGAFEKGYTPRWTEEVFTVSQVQYTDPPTYKITDCNNEEIQGIFYEQELQKTSQEIFRNEKVIRKQATSGNANTNTTVTTTTSHYSN